MATMDDDEQPAAPITVTITVSLLLPLPDEEMDAYLDYCEAEVEGGLKRQLRSTLLEWIEQRRRH